LILFDVVTVDEFRTSKLYNKDLTQELTNIKIKKGKKNKSINNVNSISLLYSFQYILVVKYGILRIGDPVFSCV
jgi:hypothetical protein